MGKVRKVCGGILGVFGVALFVIGVVVKWAIFPQVMEDLVYENLKLENGTEGWDAFVSFTFKCLSLKFVRTMII